MGLIIQEVRFLIFGWRAFIVIMFFLRRFVFVLEKYGKQRKRIDSNFEIAIIA